MKQLNKFFRNIPVGSILDVGTGTGDFLVVLKEEFPEAKIVGVDPHKESLEEATEKHSDVQFMEMAGEKLLFEDNTFDLASISMALHHLPNVQICLNEMKRVVKPGGWIVVSELFSDNLNPAQEVHKLFHHFRSTTDRLKGESHNDTFKKEEIVSAVKNAGIKVQTHFEFKKEINLITNPKELAERVEKMELMLESVRNFPEYQLLKPQIKEFEEKAKTYGFQPATRVVVIGKT